MPNFSRIISTFRKLDIYRKALGLFIVSVIILFPLAIIKLKKQIESPPALEEKAVAPDFREILAGEKNISFKTTAVAFEEEKINQVEILRDSLFLINAGKVIKMKGGSKVAEYPLPAGTQKILLSAAMEDLNLLFMLTEDRKVFSFSPVSLEFKENNMSIPANFEIFSMSAYSTYLYLTGNGIYRFPRAEGGFGQPVNWLKENSGLETVTDAAIDENIYAVSSGGIYKLFRGQKTVFNLEASATPIEHGKIFTNASAQNLYVLDSRWARIARFAKDGSLIAQYHDEALIGSREFVVDEKNSEAFVITSQNQLIKLDLR